VQRSCLAHTGTIKLAALVFPGEEAPAAIEKLMAEVEYGLQDYVLEVASVEIGQRILKRLYDLDAVAYVRFASVYRSFGDVDTFLSELRKVKRAHQKRARLTKQINGSGEFPAPTLSSPFSLHPNADRTVSVETDRLAKV
jgi:hypothetical protein